MKFIKDFLSNRTNIIEVFIVAVLITLGINLITASIFELFSFKEKNELFLYIGIILVVFAIIYFILKILWKTNISKTFEGFIIVSEHDKLPVDCERYEYLEALRRNFEAAFAENKALEHIWNDKSIKRNDKDLLIIEATEYYLIDKLSTHLTDYFNTKRLDKNQLVEFSRNDIPDILLSNRFLELFSKPMEQRPSFIKDLKKDNSRFKVVMSYGAGGTLFKEFDFVLPKGSKVSKSNGKIVIDTKRFRISLKVNYHGFGSVLPRGFEFYYCGLKSYKDFWANKINATISVKFKVRSTFSRSGWDYYEWIELFLEKIEKNFSKEYFFNSINWNQIYIQTKINEKIITAKSKSEEN